MALEKVIGSDQNLCVAAFIEDNADGIISEIPGLCIRTFNWETEYEEKTIKKGGNTVQKRATDIKQTGTISAYLENGAATLCFYDFMTFDAPQADALWEKLGGEASDQFHITNVGSTGNLEEGDYCEIEISIERSCIQPS